MRVRWNDRNEPACKLFRLIMQMRLPKMMRVVAANSPEDAEGVCFGLTMGSAKTPCLKGMPSKAVELVRAVRDMI